MRTLTGRSLIFILMVICAGGLFSAAYPVDSGSLSMRGDLFLERGFGSGYDSTALLFAPGVHYFLFPRFSIGADLHLEFRDEGVAEYQNSGGYLMLSYYMGRRSGLVFPFISAGYGLGKYRIGNMEYSYSGLKVAAGITILFNQHIGIRTLASYTLDKVEHTTGGGTVDGGRVRIGGGVVFYLF